MSIDYSQFENDDFELESGFGEGELDSGGTCNASGKYHVEIIDDERKIELGRVPEWRIDMKIVAGTNPKQSGKMIYQRFKLGKGVFESGKLVAIEALSPAARKCIFRFLRGFGLLSDADIENVAKVKLPRFGTLAGCQAIVEVANEPYRKKDQDGNEYGDLIDSYKIPWGDKVWRLDDEAVKDVPKDPESLAILASGAGVGDISDI